MGETGLLSPNDRVELIDGQIRDMSPIVRSHGGIVKPQVRIFLRAGDTVAPGDFPEATIDVAKLVGR